MRRRFIMSADKVPDNQIWYTTNDNNAVDVLLRPTVGDSINYGLGSVLVSNSPGTKCIIKTAGVITQIGINCFSNSNLVSIKMPKHIDAIRESAFYNCAYLTHVDMPNGVVDIGARAFKNCASLRTIQLPEDLENIGYSCFTFCSSLKEITLNKNVKTIGDYAFGNCHALEVLYSKAIVPPTIENIVLHIFRNTPIKKIYVPFEAVTAYKTANEWSIYSSIIEGYNFD